MSTDREKDDQRIDDAIRLFKVDIEGLVHDLKAVPPGCGPRWLGWRANMKDALCLTTFAIGALCLMVFLTALKSNAVLGAQAGALGPHVVAIR
jgi:hypothetical protein